MLARDRSHGAASTLGVCILAGCALLAAATFATADSSPRRQARTTHLGVAPADVVTLVSSGQGTNLKFYRSKDDGTAETSEFAVPAGYRLIVTDVQHAGNLSIGVDVGVLRVFVENRTTTTNRTMAALLYSDTRNFSSNFSAIGSSSGGVGAFVVGPSGRLVADAVGGSAVVATATFPANTASNIVIILRGYLAVDE